MPRTWFASEAGTYDVIVLLQEEDEDGNVVSEERGTITLKRLSAAEHAVVQDAMFDDEQGEGQSRLVLVQHAVVAWSIDERPPTPDLVADLDPVIIQQVYAAMKREQINPFGPAARARVELEREAAATTNGASRAHVELVDVADA